MNLVKKFFVFALMIATVAAFSVGPLKVDAAGNYAAGSLLALEGATDAAVYYIGSDGMKYVFPDGKTYFTWYENFDSVVRVPVAELDLYADGGAVTYRPGTKMITHENTAKVYAVEPGGTLHWLPDEATALALYGAGWAGMIQDVIPGYFSSSYVAGDDLGTTLPDGTLAMESGGSTYYYISDGAKRPFASADAFEANNFSYDYVLTTDLSGYSEGDSITGEEEALSSYMAGEGGTTTPTGGNLSVSLASDTPAAGVAVTGAARLPFTKVKLQTGATGVTIDTIEVQRGGLAQDGAFTSVDILNSNMLPIDQNSKTFNSNHKTNFTKDIVIAANTTMYIYLAGNMGTIGSTYAGEYPTLGISGITLTGGGSVVGSLPIFGNYMTTNGSLTIGTAAVTRGSYSNATSTSLEVGRTDYTFLSFQVTGSTEEMSLGQLSVYQNGTASLTTDVGGFELFQDGTKIADGVVDGKYINFTLASSVLMTKGQAYQFVVKADVLDGSSRTVQLGFYRATDLLVTGQTYGYNVTPEFSGTGFTATNARPTFIDNTFTISTGTLTVERSNTVGSENITIGNSQTLGAFKFTVKGEPVDVTALTLAIVSSTANTTADPLTNITLVNAATGAIVAGPSDPTDDLLTVAFTDTFTVPVGESVYKVVANLLTSAQWATDDTIYASISNPETVITAIGQITGNTLGVDEISPSTAIDTNTQTIKGPYLSVTRNTMPASGTVIAGQQDVELGSWNFDATNSGEDVRIISVLFAASTSAATNLTVFDGTTAKSPINDAPTSDDDGATSTFSFDDPIIISKGTSKIIKLVGDINTNAVATDTSQFGITDASTSNNPSVVAYGLTTNKRAYTAVTADDGATLTYSDTGSVTVSTSNNPNNGIVRAGSTGNIFGYIKFDALNEDLDLDQLKLYVADGAITGTAAGNYQDVLTVYLYDGSTLLGSNAIPSTGYYTFNFSNGTLTVPKSGSKTLTVKADVSTIDSAADNAPGTPAADIKFGLGSAGGFKFTGNASNSTVSETYNGSTTSAMVIHKSVPTVTYSTTSNRLGMPTALTAGAQDLFAFNVAAGIGGNEVLLYRASFEISTDGGAGVVTLTNCYLKDGGDNTVGAAVTPTEIDGGGKNLLSYTFDNPAVDAGDVYEALSISAGNSATYILNCTVGGADLTTGDYVSISLLGDTASSTPVATHGTPAAAGENNADAWSAYEQGNFIWSDNFKNRGLGSYVANATAYGQWYNGYLVSGLGTLTTTTAYTIVR